LIDTTLAHFRITAKLGEGGMGQVYRAEDSKLGREVAIKVLPDAVVQDPERLARFEREAKMLAALNHPNIAAIYGLEEADGKPFLVLELVEGDTLAERIAKGPIELEGALKVAQQIALALEAAHDQGIVHRDLKPANVKLTPNGKVKVLDFGLAKAWEPTAASGSGPLLTASPTLSHQMTEAGVLLGTAGYMSPEQARGHPVDKRSDIWAFGCVLLEMLTGRRTFGGDTVTDVIAAVVAREPEWDALPSDTPESLVRLLRRCVEKDAEKRLRDIGDVRLEIEEILEAPSPEESAARIAAEQAMEVDATTAKAGRLWMGVALVATVAAATFGALYWRAASAESDIVRASIPAPPGTEFNLDTDYPGPLAVSPDGKSVAFSAVDESGKILLWVRDLEDLTAQPMAGTDNARYPFWSPDSREIAFFDLTKLKKIEATGGPALSLCDAPNGKGGTWNRQGLIVFSPNSTATLFSVPEAGGEPTQVTEFDVEKGDNSHRHPRFLPDGEHFLYVARTSFGGVQDKTRLMVGSLEGESKELMPTVSNVEYAKGHLLYVFERTLMARPFDADKLEFVGSGYPLAEGVYFDPGAFLGVFSASEAGLLAYQTGEISGVSQDSFLEWRDREGDVLETIGQPDSYAEVVLSPDDRQAIIGLIDVETGNRDLWLLDLERQIKSRFTFADGNDWIPVWSPDGTRVAYTSDQKGASDLYVQSVVGGGDAEVLLDDEKLNFPMSWSQDSRYLLYEAWVASGPDIYALDLEDGGDPIPIVISDFFDRFPFISPDGRWLAFASDESGQMEVYVTAFPKPARKWQVSIDGGLRPRWSTSGTQIYYQNDKDLMAAPVDASGEVVRVGEVTKVLEFSPANDGYSYAVSADGERFLTIKSGEKGEREALDPMTIVLNWQSDLRE